MQIHIYSRYSLVEVRISHRRRQNYVLYLLQNGRGIFPLSSVRGVVDSKFPWALISRPSTTNGPPRPRRCAVGFVHYGANTLRASDGPSWGHSRTIPWGRGLIVGLLFSTATQKSRHNYHNLPRGGYRLSGPIDIYSTPTMDEGSY